MLARIKVLVVEDSSVGLAAIRLAMKRMPNWSTEHAKDGDAALRLCGTLAPDVVTLDLGLPGGGGLELLSEIKAAFDLPIIVVSASTYEGSPATAEALGRGADACFNKAHILTKAPAFLRALSDAALSNRLGLNGTTS